MLWNYLRSALRLIMRSKGTSAINIFGLSVGVACALLLLLFVRSEISFDQQHEKAERTYRAWVLEDWGEDQQFFNTTTPVRIGPTLQEHLPEVEDFARFDRLSATVKVGASGFNETLFMVDSTFFDVFDFDILSGDAPVMLTRPDQMVLTESSASRYFGESHPVGRTMIVELAGEEREFTVSGLVADVPENSSLQFEFLLSYKVADLIYPPGRHTAWFNVSPETYVVLRSDADPTAVKAKMDTLFDRLLEGELPAGGYRVGLQPLLDIHTNPDFPIGYAPVVNPVYVRVLSLVAVLILGIACINFVTLSMSRGLMRGREVGVRKAMGATRLQLMGQYWGEALVVSFVAVCSGALLARLLLPAFNAIAGRSLNLSPDLGTMAMLGALFVAIGLLAGLYPAWTLSGHRPVEAIRGRTSGRNEKSLLRRGLVVAQFTLSIVLLAGTLVMGDQLRFLKTMDPGFETESVMMIRTELGSAQIHETAERVRFASADVTSVERVAGSFMPFDQNGWARIGYTADDGTYRRFNANIVDHDYVRTLGLKLVQGRDFSKDQPGDVQRAFLVNEAFVRAYGWENPLQETIPGEFSEHEIIGVVEDFHFASLHSRIEPAVLALSRELLFSGISDLDYDGDFGTYVLVRFRTSNVAETVADVEQSWKEAHPDLPFSYTFLDDSLESQYRQEERLATISEIAAFLAIFIAGLGLFGLAAMSVVRRTREIGVRKVLGAGATSILSLFLREFSLLIGLAFVLAVPVAYIGLDRWLDSFAYHTLPGAGPYLMAGLGALVVMALAVTLQSMKAVLANPVDSLRDD